MTGISSTFRNLLQEFSLLPNNRGIQPTFLQISGFPHFENVVSNILAFYFDPQNAHGFGNLFLSSLMKLIEPSIIYETTRVKVRREETTKLNKRIDIFIEADTFVIAIENKIFHETNNPFTEYRNYLQEVSEGRKVYSALFHLKEPVVTDNLSGFLPVSHQTFFSLVLQELEYSQTKGREPYITFLHDVIRTIRTYGKETDMDNDTIAFFREHRREVERLLKETEVLQNDMKRKVKQLEALLDTTTMSNPIVTSIGKGGNALYYILVLRVQLSEILGLQININISPEGWRINLLPFEGTFPALRDWFELHNIPIRDRQTTPPRFGYGTDTVAYADDITLLAKEAQHLLDLVKKVI